MGTARVNLDPLPRTISFLASYGWLADEVERRERYATYDLFGCWDVLAVDTRGVMLLVQCTSKPNVGTRVKKCIANANTKELLRRGVMCEVWGWDETKADPRRVHMRIEGNEVVAREGAT